MDYVNIDAWENELFNRYNGEYVDPLELEADYYDQLDQSMEDE